MFIHTFGAYFGLAVSRMLYKKSQTNSNKEGSVYHSDIFAMVGEFLQTGRNIENEIKALKPAR